MSGRIIRPGTSAIRRGGEGIYLPGISRLGDADASLGGAQGPVFLPSATIATNSVIAGLSNGYLDGFNIALPAGPWAIVFPAVKAPTAANLDYPLLSVGALSDTILDDNGALTIGMPGQGAGTYSSYGWAASGKDDAGNVLSPRVGVAFAGASRNVVTGPQQSAGVNDGAARLVCFQKDASGVVSAWQVDNNCCAMQTPGFQTSSFGAIASKAARLGCLGKATPSSFSTIAYQGLVVVAQNLTQYQLEAIAGGVDPRAVITFNNSNGVDLLFAFNGNPTNGATYTDLIQGQTATAHGTFTPTSSILATTVDQHQVRFNLEQYRVFQSSGATTDFPLSGTVYGANGEVRVQLVNSGNTTTQVAFTSMGTSRGGRWSGVVPGATTRLADYRPWARKFISNVQVGGEYLAGITYISTGMVIAMWGQSLLEQMRANNTYNPSGTLASKFRGQSSLLDATVRDHYAPGCCNLTAGGYGEGHLTEIIGNATGFNVMQINDSVGGTSINNEWLADKVGFGTVTSPLGILTNAKNNLKRFSPLAVWWHQGEDNLATSYSDYYGYLDQLYRNHFLPNAQSYTKFIVGPLDNNFYSTGNLNKDLQMQIIRSAQIDWAKAQIAAGDTRVVLGFTVNDILRADTNAIDGIHKIAQPGGYGAYAERMAQTMLFLVGNVANSGLGPTIAFVQRISNTVKRVLFQQNGGTGLQTKGAGAPTGFAVSLSNATPTSGPTFTSPLAISGTSLTNSNTTVDITHADDGGVNPYIWYQWGLPGFGITDIAEGIDNALNDNRSPSINTTRGYPVVPTTTPIQSAWSLNGTPVNGTATISNNNRTIVPTALITSFIGSAALSGKRVFAATLDVLTTNSALIGVGNATTGGSSIGGDLFHSVGYGNSGFAAINGGSVGTVPPYTALQTVGVVVDVTGAKVWFTTDGTNFYGSAGPLTAAQVAAGTSGIDISGITGTLFPIVGNNNGSIQWTTSTTYPWAPPSGYSQL